MRVAIVTTSYPAHDGDPSGHFVASHARHLTEAGHAVTIFAPGGASDAALPPGASRVALGAGELFSWPGAIARMRERPTRALSSMGFVRRARAALRERGPFDRIAAHFLIPSAWPITSGLPGELEAYAHGADVRWLLAAPAPVRDHVVGALVRQASQIVFAAAHLRDRLITALPGDLGRRLALRSVARVPHLDTPHRDALTRPGPAPGDPYAVWVGRCVPEKRPDLAARAARSARVPLVVVGDGPLALPASVVRIGRVRRDVALAWIAHAAVLVSTSLEEGAPSTVREARLFGVPVVATPSGDIERWAEGDTGIRVVRDEAELTEALRPIAHRTPLAGHAP